MVKASYEHTQRIVKRAGTLLQSSPRKRALLIGISYDGVSKLESSHSAVDKWKGVLEGYGYCGEDVIVMKDTESELGSKYYPTHDNITRVLEKEFILPNEENVVYFFLYSGHSDQTDCTDGTEEDGKNEVIITADGEHILDDFLKKTLVDALPSRCRLNAILDTCHSGTLMDLIHYRCNRIASYSSYVRRVRRRWAELLEYLDTNNTPTSQAMKYTNLISTAMVPAPVKAKTCPGLCKRSSIRRANVVCISAARDGEEAYEANGISIAQKIADYLKDHRNPTYKKLMRAISFHIESQDIERRFCEGRTLEEHTERQDIEPRLCKGRTFVWKEQHPELSSQVPLNMNNRLIL